MTDNDDDNDKRKYEDRIRKLAERLRYRVRKSRQRRNYGRYMLVEGSGDHRIIVGDRFDASLEEIEACLRRQQPFVGWFPPPTSGC